MAWAISAAVLVIGAEIASVASIALASTAISGALIVNASFAVAGYLGYQAAGAIAGAIFGDGSSGGTPGGTVSAARAQGILLNTASTVEPLPVIYGTRKVGGTLCLCEVSGDSNQYLNLVIALAEGEIDSVTNIYIDDLPDNDPRFNGGLVQAVDWKVGTDSQTASIELLAALPGSWTAAHTGTGVAYLYLRLKYSQDAFSGLPTITANVRGKKVYDPRTGLTAYSNNPALCVRDYLTNNRYGRGIAAALIDDASIITAANYCDELVAIPGGTQARYTCDGIVNVDNTAFDNIKTLLSSCRGMLVYSAGIYKLVLDKIETPGFAFTEDNITGGWTIAQPGKRAKFNRVTAGIFNPANNWQPDYAISDSTAYRAQDNGLLLEDKINLPYTANVYRGQQLAGLRLKQSRFGLSVHFNALQEGLRAEVGDVVSITHSTPGWVAKPFRITQITISSTDEVEVTASEYDDSVYALDTLTAITGSRTTNLPDVFATAAPGVPSVVESLYATTGSTGVRARATATWSAGDSFVVAYLPEYKLASSSSYTALPVVRTATAIIDDLAPGVYNFRVRAENAIGTRSAYSPVTSKEIVGLSAAPAAINGLTVIAISGRAYAAWDVSPDLDVRIGGRIIVRHTPLTSGALWENGIVLDDFNGDAVNATLPLLTGTYMVKAKDSSDNYSATMGSFVATESQITGFTTTHTSTQAPAFAGSKTGTAVDGSTLKLDGLTAIDSMAALVDAWGFIDNLGGVASAGSYYFDADMNFGAVASRRLSATIQALAIDTGDLIDDRGLIDDWGVADGGVVNDTDATLYYRTTQTNPTGSPVWGAWTPFMTADVTSWGVQYRLDLASASPVHNILISTLTVIARSSP